MKIVVTGSSGHLGEGLVRRLRPTPHRVVSVDRVASAFTSHVGSVADRDSARRCVAGADLAGEGRRVALKAPGGTATPSSPARRSRPERLSEPPGPAGRPLRRQRRHSR